MVAGHGEELGPLQESGLKGRTKGCEDSSGQCSRHTGLRGARSPRSLCLDTFQDSSTGTEELIHRTCGMSSAGLCRVTDLGPISA